MGIATAASIFSDFWHDQLVEHDRQWLFLVLAGFFGSFAFIRLSTRLMRSPRVPWWPGSVVSESGVHLHHLVWGISLMIAAGTISFAGFATTPVYEICAAFFGIGVGLTIDEFALWVHLDDVYWAREGRASIDAAIIVAVLMVLALIGLRPFELEGDLGIVSVLTTVLLLLALSTLAIAKGRLFHAVLGVFVPAFSIYAASRLAKPGSVWARRIYAGRNPGKQAKSEARFRPDRRTERFKEWVRDVIGGATAAEYEARLAKDSETQLQAAETVRSRAGTVASAEDEQSG